MHIFGSHPSILLDFVQNNILTCKKSVLHDLILINRAVTWAYIYFNSSIFVGFGCV